MIGGVEAPAYCLHGVITDAEAEAPAYCFHGVITIAGLKPGYYQKQHVRGAVGRGFSPGELTYVGRAEARPYWGARTKRNVSRIVRSSGRSPGPRTP